MNPSTTKGFASQGRCKSDTNMTAHDIPVPRDPKDNEALSMFQEVEELFPSKSLGENKWYILAVSSPLRST
jgi:hypothetical protein